MPKLSCPVDWTEKEVCRWLNSKNFQSFVEHFEKENIDGKSLLVLSEDDVKAILRNIDFKLGDVKKLHLSIQQLKVNFKHELLEKGYDPVNMLQLPQNKLCFRNGYYIGDQPDYYKRQNSKAELIDSSQLQQSQGDYFPFTSGTRENSYQSSRSSEDGHTINLRPEFTKAVIALGYLFVVTWITSFVMVIVHDRVPDMKRYPPLPDIFLDNVPYIPWAFHMCEWTATVLVFIWAFVLIFHKHRFILLRRFFALCGTVFLLRCITMLITSLSVPGSHLKCSPRISTQVSEDFFMDILSKISQAYTIWKNAGLSIRGVRTCGDYMFSGHSVVLTMLNFFITEYTPRDLHLLHIFTWVLNMFGIFFILSGHEHYSIDVFIAFYITSRLFLYYHTLANNQALMQRDSTRTRIWFPLFSFFESSVGSIVPNEYESVWEICENLYACCKFVCIKLIFAIDMLMIKSSQALKAKPVFGQPDKRPMTKRSKKPKNM